MLRASPLAFLLAGLPDWDAAITRLITWHTSLVQGTLDTF